MLRSIRTAYTELLTTARQLLDAVNRNSELTEQNIAHAAEIRELLAGQAISTENTAKAVAYLAAAEKHRRESSGQPQPSI
jgi:hypothetical protein